MLIKNGWNWISWFGHIRWTVATHTDKCTVNAGSLVSGQYDAALRLHTGLISKSEVNQANIQPLIPNTVSLGQLWLDNKWIIEDFCSSSVFTSVLEVWFMALYCGDVHMQHLLPNTTNSRVLFEARLQVVWEQSKKKQHNMKENPVIHRHVQKWSVMEWRDQLKWTGFVIEVF